MKLLNLQRRLLIPSLRGLDVAVPVSSLYHVDFHLDPLSALHRFPEQFTLPREVPLLDSRRHTFTDAVS